MIASSCVEERSSSLTSLAWRLAAAAGLLVFAVGCGDGKDAAAPALSGAPDPSGQSEQVGSLELALTLGQNLVFDTFDYVITGPAYTKAERFDVSDSTTVAVTIGSIPVGTGYSITLMGRSAEPVAVCSGSAAFSVSPGATTSVPVVISCHEAEAVAAVPIPPLAPAALGMLLFAAGTLANRRRSKR